MTAKNPASRRKHQPPLKITQLGVQMRLTTGQIPSQPKPAPVASPVAPAAVPGRTLRAPMPGLILEMRVKPGDRLQFGDEVGILEAMKMKSSLRCEMAGTVAEVRVSAGQTVAHGDVLVVFE